MAEAILDQVHVSNMFNLRGIVAVVTGGGSVSAMRFSAEMECSWYGYRALV